LKGDLAGKQSEIDHVQGEIDARAGLANFAQEA
jgi:hypothetical protein